ncbi:methyltransferase domain-containing protein [Salmonella enterica subsp. enterica]|uniref:methyltransferase domain-containing protein n=1 Tax=Salmonella enterica TaxID=28901 RepID=UPI00193CA041|nr:methyltransferase domain-containing protein [Salmonella enterica]EBK2664772.1 methyltransferase domain-containing protein [Salmonella enterica subsp. enterica serovar Enteritidis]EDW1488855.1 methyltransferase domain-containing protein [Salmonella enterica subsp. enterica serovar Hvittingfoss]EEH4119226.1 methyltransferase domain-containing protein [Salmonella enterica subsp. enterica serovar Hvittingfoss]EEJ7167407.1 methyltransferase domain-containing protein [Salmonella enterica subsp. en
MKSGNIDKTNDNNLNKESVDELITALPGNWRFDHEVVQAFDEHVRRSVPFYDQVQTMISDISEWFVRDGTTIYDLGTSTGETIYRLKDKHKSKKNIRYIGIDNSLPMLEKARIKCGDDNIQFLHQNIISVTEFPAAGLVTAIYSLQFLPLSERRIVVERVSRDLYEGGAFIIVEKVRAESSYFEDIWLELYWDMKQSSGLNSEQVLSKAKSLRGILMPLTLSENIKILEDSGFIVIDIFMKWYNFVGIVAVKTKITQSILPIDDKISFQNHPDLIV